MVGSDRRMVVNEETILLPTGETCANNNDDGNNDKNDNDNNDNNKNNKNNKNKSIYVIGFYQNPILITTFKLLAWNFTLCMSHWKGLSIRLFISTKAICSQYWYYQCLPAKAKPGLKQTPSNHA